MRITTFRLRPVDGVLRRLRDEEGKTGPALGLLDGADYQTSVSTFGGGERGVLFTDGIFDVDSAKGDEFGEEKLMASFDRYASLPVKEMFEAVLNDVCLLAFESGDELSAAQAVST